jgi:hypothetical protein
VVNQSQRVQINQMKSEITNLNRAKGNNILKEINGYLAYVKPKCAVFHAQSVICQNVHTNSTRQNSFHINYKVDT